MAGAQRPSLSVVIMAYNEEANLPFQAERTLAFLREHTRDWQLVIVDDGSTDGTGAQADALAAADPDHVLALHHPANRGMGGAIKTGYAAATCEWVTQLPADGQVDPRVFLRFFPHLAEAEIVLSVYRQRDDGGLRKVLSWGFQALVRLTLGHRGDYTGTMMLRRDLLDRIGPLEAETFFVNMEVPIKALQLGVPHALVEIEAQPRLSGQSKVRNVRRIARVAREMVGMRLRRGRR